jgi:hypothetical protein
MKRLVAALGLLSASLSVPAIAGEGPVPAGIPHLEHVFIIMMENHGYGQIIGNPNAPFINAYAQYANLATNYFAVAHPSLTNYLEVVGGSNFGVLTDNYPDWHNGTCVPNLVSGVAATDNPASPLICPIAGSGIDAATPAVDFTNETQGAPGENNIDGTASFAAAHATGKTIADQLDAAHMSWKSYQESLPVMGADSVNYSDGYFSNLTDFTKIQPALNPPLTSSGIVAQYAAKHNPFVYFASGQTADSLAKSVDFEGADGLYADLASGHVPDLSFIAPNQCHDQHGRGNAGPFCNFDPSDVGTQAGLNPALILVGDITVRKIVTAIHDSRAWKEGPAAIVLVWDENDYSLSPNTNQVVAIVDTNYRRHRESSADRYTHFSLLKTIEGGFRLPCLNHACDPATKTMKELFEAR